MDLTENTAKEGLVSEQNWGGGGKVAARGGGAIIWGLRYLWVSLKAGVYLEG